MAARIVVAEDTAALRDHLAVTLRQEGYDVWTATNGAEVLALVEEDGKPELLLLDLAMPGMDGITCLRRLRQRWNRQALPVIVLSAHSNQSNVLEVVKLGISDYLLKSSFSQSTLLRKVARVLLSREVSDGVGRVPSAGSTTEPTKTTPPEKGAERGVVAQVPRRAGNGIRKPVKSRTPAVGTRSTRAPLTRLIERAELERTIRRLVVPRGFSPAVNNLLQTIENPEASLNQIAESASLDQALAAKFLWWANSVASSRGAPVTTMRKAIVRIGTNKIRETALTLGVLDRFGTDANEALHYGRFWEHSVTVAVIAAELARSSPRTRDLESDVAFTAGLLHDVGRLILVEQMGDLYSEVLNASRRHNVPLVEAEREMLGCSHARAAEYPLVRWQISDAVVRAVLLHHHPVDSILQMTRPERLLTTILLLANNLSQAMLLGDSGADAFEDVTQLTSALGLTDEALFRLEEQVLQSWRDLRAVAAMCSWHDWPDHLSVLRTELNTRAHPRLLDSQPGWSVYRQLFARLFGEVDDENLNLWVVRVEHWGNSESYMRHIAEWEQAHSKGPLPLLLIAPAASQEVPALESGERPVFVLPNPLSVRRLIQAVNGSAPRGTVLREEPALDFQGKDNRDGR